ncbi:uncharacterized protein LOC119583788 [Penaeus monodon]|uniref:uncharacterized protein LOC119583788 n=1 Tax=Penaeus monodon TaxID=6687 RepID=UPI0018A70F59|nr:uncharacterized protein LOC119583788 [Penaeus monodon]
MHLSSVFFIIWRKDLSQLILATTHKNLRKYIQKSITSFPGILFEGFIWYWIPLSSEIQSSCLPFRFLVCKGGEVGAKFRKIWIISSILAILGLFFGYKVVSRRFSAKKKGRREMASAAGIGLFEGEVEHRPIKPTPLILHCDLQRPDFTDYLGSGFKIRVSKCTPRDSVILPTCGVAVLLIYLSRISTTSASASATTSASASTSPGVEGAVMKETLGEVIERIKAFTSQHKVGILVLVGSVFGEEEVGGVIATIQRELLPRPPPLLPAHGDAQAAAHIQTLAKATQPETRRVVQERMEGILKEATSQDFGVILARAMGLSQHQASVLLDTFGSLGAVAEASAAEIHRRTPLDAATAASVAAFFARDTVTL